MPVEQVGEHEQPGRQHVGPAPSAHLIHRRASLREASHQTDDRDAEVGLPEPDQPVRTLRPGGIDGQGVTQPPVALPEIGPDEPEVGDAAHQREGGRGVRAGDEPVQGGPQVVQLGVEPVPPGEPVVSAQATASLLGDVEEVRGVALPDRVGLARRDEALPGVLPQRPQL